MFLPAVWPSPYSVPSGTKRQMAPITISAAVRLSRSMLIFFCSFVVSLACGFYNRHQRAIVLNRAVRLLRVAGGAARACHSRNGGHCADNGACDDACPVCRHTPPRQQPGHKTGRFLCFLCSFRVHVFWLRLRENHTRAGTSNRSTLATSCAEKSSTSCRKSTAETSRSCALMARASRGGCQLQSIA